MTELDCEEEAARLAEEAASAVLRREGLEQASIDVTFAASEEIRRLNKETRGTDSVTDVLSFPLYNGRREYEGRAVKENSLLGDVVICLERAKAQAEEYGHSIRREICFLAAHGALHCCWYDHGDSEGERTMFAIQDDVLNIMGVRRDEAD